MVFVFILIINFACDRKLFENFLNAELISELRTDGVRHPSQKFSRKRWNRSLTSSVSPRRTMFSTRTSSWSFDIRSWLHLWIVLTSMNMILKEGRWWRIEVRGFINLINIYILLFKETHPSYIYWKLWNRNRASKLKLYSKFSTINMKHSNIVQCNLILLKTGF